KRVHNPISKTETSCVGHARIEPVRIQKRRCENREQPLVQSDLPRMFVDIADAKVIGHSAVVWSEPVFVVAHERHVAVCERCPASLRTPATKVRGITEARARLREAHPASRGRTRSSMYFD